MKELIREVQAAEEELLIGNVILYPTDTVWGIGCDATDKKAVEKIFKIKERDTSKAMIILVADADMLANYVEEVPDNFEELVTEQERPTTYIFSQSKNLPDALVGE